MKRLKVLLVIALTLTLGCAGLAAPVTVHAASPTATVCNTLGSGSDCSQQPANGISINGVIAATINLLSVLVGVAAVVMIIIAGFKYVTSGGDSSKVASAKNALIYAIVGLVVVALAQAIVRYVLERVNAPDCPAGQTLNNGTNKCVKKTGANGMTTYYYAVADKRYSLNYSPS